METPKTLQAAIIYFSDADRAFAYALKFRWPNGLVACPRCNSEKHSFIKTRKIWMCYGCKKQFSLKVGTIFEDSPLGLDKWMMVMWMLANCKNGISSYEVSKAIGVMQRSAWFMLHRIREAMTDRSGSKLGGSGEPVEMDETFVGGAIKNMHKKARIRSNANGGNKTIVLGMLERGGKVKAKAIATRQKRCMDEVITANVAEGSNIYTDEFPTYGFLETPYVRDVINHGLEYVNGHIHTNGIENFWSLLKRGLRGTYISVEPFHIDTYIAEQVFRYNTRKTDNDQTRFETVMGQVAGKRLTYAQLTGANAAH